MRQYDGSLRLGRRVLAGVIGASLAISAYAQQPAAPGAAKPMTVEQRLARLERLLANQNLVELFMRLESLQKEVEALRGQVEVQTHELESLKNRQRELYLDVDTRLQQVEAAAKAALSQSNASAGMLGEMALPIDTTAGAIGVSAGEGTGVGVTDAAAEAAEPADEGSAYQRAFNFLKEGDYAAAVTAFNNFLAQYPNGVYADNAQYWVGEARYVTRDFALAVQEFSKVVQSYPDSSKAADAQLKIGFSYYELGKWTEARQALEAVSGRFAGTTAARLAAKRLQQMKLEGKI